MPSSASGGPSLKKKTKPSNNLASPQLSPPPPHPPTPPRQEGQGVPHDGRGAGQDHRPGAGQEGRRGHMRRRRLSQVPG